MARSEELGLTWAEETVTDILVVAASAHVKVVPFTRKQEGDVVGADWLWWWVGQDESFGMLVQAKRLKKANPVNGQSTSITNMASNAAICWSQLTR